MKRVGIVTLYYNNANYGGLLQAFALQKSIEKLGYDATQISYDFPTGYNDGYSSKKYLIKRIIKQFLPGYKSNHIKYENVLHQFQERIPHSAYVDAEGLKKLNASYEAFVCGSDQMWNPIGWQPNFFLSFSNKPKIAYAPSVARDELSTDELSYLDKLTKNFTSLSVREKNTSEYLTDKLGREYKLVPDPTLLLTKEEWNSFFKLREERKRPYIFAYFLGFNETQRNECVKFANENDMDIYFIPYMKEESYEWDRKNLNLCVENYSIDNFIDLIRNADLILTDSFHGTVFSCIFEKPFIVLDRKLIKNEKSMNSRMYTLFYELGISSNRFINNLSDVKDYMFSEDEKRNINKSMDKWRKVGISYLKESLKDI